MRNHYVYIMTNHSRTLYTGVTNDLERRVEEHRSKLVPGFTQRYSITLLVYWEEYADIREAIAREKEIKDWRRSKKIVLIESMNPHWDDLGCLRCDDRRHAGAARRDRSILRAGAMQSSNVLRRSKEDSSLRSE